jgi:hypothetical protein
MRNFARVSLTIAALSVGFLLAGCEDFDPTAIFDSEMFNTKKKLPGERRAVFPEGTPGVSQGVPPELMKGYQAAAQPQASEAPKQEAAAAAEPKPKPKPKKIAKPAEQPSAQAAAPQQDTSEPSPWPNPPAQQAPVASRWPDSPQQSGGVVWPDPPATR